MVAVLWASRERGAIGESVGRRRHRRRERGPFLRPIPPPVALSYELGIYGRRLGLEMPCGPGGKVGGFIIRVRPSVADE